MIIYCRSNNYVCGKQIFKTVRKWTILMLRTCWSMRIFPGAAMRNAIDHTLYWHHTLAPLIYVATNISLQEIKQATNKNQKGGFVIKCGALYSLH